MRYESSASRSSIRKTRTETGEVSELGGVVGHGAHEPVRGRLPRGVEDTAEDVQPDVGDVGVILEVNPRGRTGGERLAGVVPAECGLSIQGTDGQALTHF